MGPYSGLTMLCILMVPSWCLGTSTQSLTLLYSICVLSLKYATLMALVRHSSYLTTLESSNRRLSNSIYPLWAKVINGIFGMDTCKIPTWTSTHGPSQHHQSFLLNHVEGSGNLHCRCLPESHPYPQPLWSCLQCLSSFATCVQGNWSCIPFNLENICAGLS